MTHYYAGTDIELDMRERMGSPAPCLLCGELGVVCGYFIPLDPWNFSPVPPRAGHLRMFTYALCPAHPRTRELLQQAKAEIRTRCMP